MPNRVIREGFLDSEAVHNLSDAAECLYHRLLLAADDAGRFDGRLDILRARLFPLDSSRRVSDVEARLRECFAQGLVFGYERSGKPFLQVTKWQKCGKALHSRFPDANGSFAIEYVELETRDGPKDFVSSSLGCVPHADPMPTPSGRGNAESSTETETGTKTKAKTETLRDVVFPLELDVPEFLTTWELWIKHRQDLAHPITPTQAKSQLKKLAKWGSIQAIASLEKSIERGWRGFFGPGDEPKGGSSSKGDDWKRRNPTPEELEGEQGGDS